MYTVEEFDKIKTKALKYILYKKRTEQEVRQKLNGEDSNIIDDVIEYLKDSGYINDSDYIDRAINEFIELNTLSIKEVKYKLQQKGISNAITEEYIQNNYDKMYEYEKQSAEKIYEKKKTIMDLQEIKAFLYKRGYMEDVIKGAIK